MTIIVVFFINVTDVFIRNLIEKEVLGEIFMVQLNCYWNRDERYYKQGGWKGTEDLDGGTLFTQFSHFIDIMYWLFGDIDNIQGKFADFTHKNITDFEPTPEHIAKWKKIKEITSELDVPKGAGLIVRTAGAKRNRDDILRDYEYPQFLKLKEDVNNMDDRL